jgi:hypothetical protein
LYIVGGNLSLLVLGYWQSASKEQDLGHYSLAPDVLLLSGAALLPALLAAIATRRGGTS